jgi:kynurenine formamidase
MDVPAEAEVLAYFDQLSNWGRWGPDDQLGTLNFVTPEKRRSSAGLVTEGISVSCAWELNSVPQADHAGRSPQRYMLRAGQGLHDPDPPERYGRLAGAMEFFGLVFHGHSVTHIDAFSHVFWDKKMYNGRPAERVSVASGAVENSITALQCGVVTRGILLDIPRLQGRDWLQPGEGVFPADLEAAEQEAGVRVGAGDAVLLRTGEGRKKRDTGPTAQPGGSLPGWHAASLPWLHDRSVALIGADVAQDVMPSGYPDVVLPVHAVGLVAMGLWLLDNCDLEELAATCARLGRWEFQLVIAPLRIVGGTGSPVNPIALF